jgi:photosystem II stability/assembly factor-like uncharacterized protein
LDGHNVTSAIAREGVILAGTTTGVFRSDDSGETWQVASDGLTTRHVRWMAFHPGLSDYEFVGTEPAAIFVSYNGSLSWRECPEVARLRDKHGWMLPYSLQAGCVRGFTFHGTRAYAAVEVGGALRSDDGGQTWQVSSAGLHVPWRRRMVERFEQVGKELFAVLSNGELLVAPLASLQWKRVLMELHDVHAVLYLYPDRRRCLHFQLALLHSELLDALL